MELFDFVKLINMGKQVSDAAGTVTEIMGALGKGSRAVQSPGIQGLKRIRVLFSDENSPIALMYKDYCRIITHNDDFDEKHKTHIFTADEAQLWMVNATVLVNEKPKFKHLILSQLGDILLNYIKVKGGGDPTQIKDPKIFAISSLFAYLLTIDRTIPVGESGNLTMRFLLKRLNDLCTAFLEHKKVTQSRSHKLQNCIDNFLNKTKEYLDNCLINDSKELLRHFSPICADQMETLQSLCTQQTWLLPFKNPHITTRIADPKNIEILVDAKNYQNLASKKKLLLGGLAELIVDQSSYEFVTKYMFGIGLFIEKNEISDNIALNNKLAQLKTNILEQLQEPNIQDILNLPGRNNDLAEKEYKIFLNAISDFIAATNLLKLLTQEINYIRNATNTLGELAGFLGNTSFINTLEMIQTLTESLPNLVNAISRAGNGLLEKGTITKEMTASSWYKDLTALDSFHKLIKEQGIEINSNVNQMLEALKNEQMQGKFEGILADLELHLRQTTVTEAKESKEDKETKDQKTQPILQSSEQPQPENDNQEVKSNGTQLKYTSEVHTFFSALNSELKTIHCRALATTLEEAKSIQPAKGLAAAAYEALFAKSTLSTAIINPADYFKVVHYPKFAITSSLMSLIDDYRFKKEVDWLRWTHESVDITDPKVLFVGIVLTYKEEFERTISLGDSHTQTAFQILQELSEVIRVFSTIKPFSESSDPSNSCIALAYNMQVKLQEDFARKTLLDKQKVIYDNAKKLNDSLNGICYDLSKGLLEITTGKFVGDIFANTTKTTLINECTTYSQFKEMANKKKMKDILEVVSDEEIFTVVKYLLSPKKEDKNVLNILLLKFTERFKGKQLLADEQKLYEAVRNLLENLEKIRIHMHQQSKLMKGLQDIGEIGVLLNPKTSESLQDITATLQSVQTSLNTIQADGPIIFRRNDVETESLGYFPKDNLIMSHISEAATAAVAIKAEITPEKLADQFGQALETIVKLQAYSEKDKPRIDRAWEICKLIKTKQTDKIAAMFLEEEETLEQKSNSSSHIITMAGNSKLAEKQKELNNATASLSNKQKRKSEIDLQFDSIVNPLQKYWRDTELAHYEAAVQLENLEKKIIPELEEKEKNLRPWFSWFPNSDWQQTDAELTRSRNNAKTLVQQKDSKKKEKDDALEKFKAARDPLVRELKTLETEITLLSAQSQTLLEELKRLETAPTPAAVSQSVAQIVPIEKKQDVGGLIITKEQIKALITAIETGLQRAKEEYQKDAKQSQVEQRFGAVTEYFKFYELGAFVGPEDLGKRLRKVLMAVSDTRKAIEDQEGIFSTSGANSKVVFRNHLNLEINKNRSALAVLMGVNEKDLSQGVQIRYKKPYVILTAGNAEFNLETLAQKKFQVVDTAKKDEKAIISTTAITA